ncbi:PREDICTED: serine/threonine-protein phosphatase 6 regulatory ankyrin repeat subunit B-like [Amphimedon queenslandica]|uniref:Uncharacterized protein n=1 Tax=Amphimedon queenslandica TaxID=400682 RepID=A0AAN0JJJ0_AMPQE|nr:PREDICTED: serine/threonine-protein phosphatase 6 regulatory ankyrin repeat subunit B-like [Amphimedon queenslandica]|eukprot:XP_019856956.1 PREDICTED: serine/threonine-protein phosphatase 6 regulatory ankyrin repeat subunit B-like [Amphimedon queenslandica]
MASYKGHLNIAQYLVNECHVDPDIADSSGNTGLLYSALGGHIDLVIMFLKKKCNVSQYSLNASQPDYKGVVPLALASKSGSINAVEYIMNTTDIDINITCNEGRTPLHYSCRHGNVDLSQYLIEVQDSDINITDNKEWNALDHSAISGNMKLVQYFINNHQLPLSSFALIQAVYSTKLSLIKLLVNEYKLGPQVKGGDGMQAVHCAAQVGAIDVLEYLVKDCGCYMDGVGGATNMNVFHYCTTNGHYLFIKYVINNYPQYTSLLHSTDDRDTLPIHYACASGVIQLVKLLINVMKCDVTTVNKESYTCVTWACRSGNLNLLKLLIKHCNLNPRIFGISSSLEVAVMNGCVHILEWLRQEYHINAVSFKNGVLPFYSMQYNHLYCLKHLLNNYSFDINATTPFDDTQSTLLHIACQEGHVAIVLFLTSLPQLEEHQLDLTIKDYNGIAPVHVACEEGSSSIVNVNNNEEGLLHGAAESGNKDLIQFLVESHGLDPESQDKNGVTCLHILAKQGDKEIYEYLVPRIRNNPTPKDKAGRSPLHYAGRHYEMSVYLIQSFNIHPEDKDIKGFTGVHAACRGGNIQLVSHYLSNLKCDKNILTNSSKGLLYFACRSGNLDLVRVLIDKFDLVPVQGDVDGARSVNAESIVKFVEARISLSKLVREFVEEAEKRQLVPIATKPHPSFLS